MTAGQGNHSSADIMNLPLDMFMWLTKHLDASDLLEFRLIIPNRKQLNSLLEEVLSRLYVMPSKKSIDNFTQICGSAFYQPRIKEVVFIPRVLDNHREEASSSLAKYKRKCEHEANYGNGPKAKLVREDRKFYHGLVEDNELYCPSRIYRSTRDDRRMALEGVQMGNTLSGLNNLAKASVCMTIGKPGLNADSLWYSDEYADVCIGDRPHKQSTNHAARLAASMAELISLTTPTEVFLRSLAALGVNTQQLMLGQRWPDQLPFSLDHPLSTYEQRTWWTIIAPKITELIVSCEDFEYGGDIALATWDAFFSAAINLQSLKIYLAVGFRPSAWAERDSGKPTIVELALQYICRI